MQRTHRRFTYVISAGLLGFLLSACTQIDAQVSLAGPSSKSDSASATPSSSVSSNPKTFDGVVNAHDVEEPGDIEINGNVYTLDLVQPVGDYCSLNDRVYETALQIKRDLLPIGQRVYAVIGQEPNQIFLHLSRRADPVPAIAPPAQSVNEMLVRSGFWVLDEYRFDTLADEPGAEIVTNDYFEPTVEERPYIPLLVEAANEAVRKIAGAVAVCDGSDFSYAFGAGIAFDVDTRRQEIWDKNNSQNSGGGSWGWYDCDGDNDGICYE